MIESILIGLGIIAAIISIGSVVVLLVAFATIAWREVLKGE